MEMVNYAYSSKCLPNITRKSGRRDLNAQEFLKFSNRFNCSKLIESNATNSAY